MKSNIAQLKIAEKYLGESCPNCCSMRNNCCCYYVSKVFKQAGNASLFYGGKIVTYCPNAIKWCKTQLAQIPPYIAMPSDIIFFDWNGNNTPDHIGFVDHRISDQEIATLEGNTTSKYVVARRVRTAKYVQGIFRPHFKPTSFNASKRLKVDGQFGYNSIAVMQKWLGVKIDAILGRGTIKALQKKLKIEQDGSWGKGTSKALQKLIGTEVDGEFGEKSVKAFQGYLNDKVFGSIEPTPITPTVKPQTVPTPSEPTVEVKADKYKVIDVSVWQGNIDWAKVKADGVVGAIIRYADGNMVDSKFEKNMSEAKAQGLHIGSYIFSRAKTIADAESEATRLYEACKQYQPDLPLYIDLEDSQLSKYAEVTAKAFLDKMEALGGRGGVYANLTWWNKCLANIAEEYSESPLWIAQYNDKITHKTPSLFGMWQYSSSGKVDGISGKVDMDWLYTPYWETAPKVEIKEDIKVEPSIPQLKVDGHIGKSTIIRMQEFFGTMKDGIVSGQKESLYKYYSSFNKAQIRFCDGGSIVITKLQEWLGVKADGVLGKDTVKAWQRKLGVKADGYFGEASAKAWQKYLNTHEKPTITNGDKLAAKARELCWAKGTDSSKYAYDGGSATEAFKKAIDKAYPNRSNWSKAPRKGASCDVLVGTVVRASGIDPNYPRGFDEQIKYTSPAFQRLVFKNVSPYEVSQDDDIILYHKNAKGTSKHTCLRADGVIYEAQFEKTYGHVNASIKKKLDVKRPYVVILRAK